MSSLFVIFTTFTGDVKIKNYYKGSRSNVTSCIQLNEESLTGLLTSCIETAFKYTLLKEKLKRREDEKEDLSSYWMTLGKEDTVNLKRKH